MVANGGRFHLAHWERGFRGRGLTHVGAERWSRCPQSPHISSHLRALVIDSPGLDLAASMNYDYDNQYYIELPVCQALFLVLCLH